MECQNRMLTHTLILLFCHDNYKFSEPCKESLTVWKKQKIMCFKKRTDKRSCLPFLSIFIYRHGRFVRLYKMVHNVKLKIVCFCGFETFICILLMSGDR